MQSGNFVRVFRGIQVRAVAKNYDGYAILRESLNHGAKSHSASGVPHAWMPVERIQKPAETVADRFPRGQIVAIGFAWPMGLRTIDELNRRDSGSKLGFAEERVLLEGFVPLCHVAQVRIDAAITQRG